jgi:Xaa-Pro aminopeptidase
VWTALRRSLSSSSPLASVVDAAPVLETARAVKTPLELEIHRDNARLVEDGDLVAFDTDLVGPFGYLTDISRTYLCGDRQATTEQREVYRAAHEFVHESIPEFVAGRSFAELGEKLGNRIPERYRQQRYPFIAHGCGAVDEYPVVRVDDHHGGVLEPGMVLSVEGYMGAVGGTVGAKYEEQIIITEGAPELISFAPADDRLL